METITMCFGADQAVAPIVVFRLEDGMLTMQLRQKEMNSRILETLIDCMTKGSRDPESYAEPVFNRLWRYIEEAHRDGVMGEGRCLVAQGKARKLQRFLQIKGLSSLTARDITPEIILEFRQFIYDEYLYVPQYPQLYPSGHGRRAPKRRCKDTTVVHDLRILQAFFRELEDVGEISRSPFKGISGEKRKSIMHIMYDAPVFLKADELRRLMDTPVPPELQQTKDIFVLNCALGCRIGDLKRLTMDKLAVSADGIPYIHYMPSKTMRSQATNREIQTPLIRPALEIIQRTRLAFNGHNPQYERQVYNKSLRKLLKFCGIDRRVCLFDPVQADNLYRPVYEVASSKLARKTHVDMLTKVQINYYAAGLHREGSDAVFRYTSLDLADRFTLLNTAFGTEDYRVEGSVGLCG